MAVPHFVKEKIKEKIEECSANTGKHDFLEETFEFDSKAWCEFKKKLTEEIHKIFDNCYYDGVSLFDYTDRE